MRSRAEPLAGLVLAAGAGTRFGDCSKLLADLHGRPVVEHVIDAMCSVTELARVVVVLGARADELLAAVEFGRAETVICENWRTGLASSLACGVAALTGAERVIVCLGDSPTVRPVLVRRLLSAPPGARAIYDGRPGHPVVLGPDQLTRLRSLSGDVGARELLGEGPLIECGDLASGRDVDTTEDLEEMRGATRAVV